MSSTTNDADLNSVDLNSVLINALDNSNKPIPKSKTPKWKIITIVMVVLTAFSVAIFMFIRSRNSGNGSATSLPDGYCKKADGVDCSSGPVVTLKNPFVARKSDLSDATAISNADINTAAGINNTGPSPYNGTVRNPPNCYNISSNMNTMKDNGIHTPSPATGLTPITFYAGSTQFWSSGFFISSCSCSNGPKMNTSRVPINMDPLICKAQLPEWRSWPASNSQSIPIDTYNGNVQIYRVKSQTGWVELGDFAKSLMNPTESQKITYSSVPTFWTLQGSQTKGSMISCLQLWYDTSYMQYLQQSTNDNGYIKEQPQPYNTNNVWYALPVEDIVDTVQRTFPVVGYVSSKVVPYQGWLGLLRSSANVPAQSDDITTYNRMTRYARMGDIVVQTAKLTVNKSPVTLNYLLNQYGYTFEEWTYLQALNMNATGSYIQGKTLSQLSVLYLSPMPIGSWFLIAPLPEGYTIP